MRKIWDMEAELRKDVHVIESKELRECLDTVHEAIQEHKDEVPRDVYNAFYDSVAKFRASESEREEMIKEYSRGIDDMALYNKGDMMKLAKMAKKLGRWSLTDDLAERKQALEESRGGEARAKAPCPFTR